MALTSLMIGNLDGPIIIDIPLHALPAPANVDFSIFQCIAEPAVLHVLEPVYSVQQCCMYCMHNSMIIGRELK